MSTSTAELELYLCFLQDTGFSIPATKSAKHVNSSSVLECHAAFGPLELAYVFNELICGSSADWTTLGVKAYHCFEAFYHQLLSYCSASATGSGTTAVDTATAAIDTTVSDSTCILEEIEPDVDMFETDTATPELVTATPVAAPVAAPAPAQLPNEMLQSAVKALEVGMDTLWRIVLTSSDAEVADKATCDLLALGMHAGFHHYYYYYCFYVLLLLVIVIVCTLYWC
jgi:hypothetical protein